MKTVAIFMVGILLFTSVIVFHFSPTVKSDGYGYYPAPTTGDWIISNNTYVENETIILTGNLTIQAGGNLTLRNVTLKMNCSSNGQYYIEVLSGGSMKILDIDENNATVTDASWITATDANYHFNFWVRDGSHFEMKNSNLTECGYFWFYLPSKQGLLIETDTAVIDHCNISNCYDGIILYGSDAIVSNNMIEWCDSGVWGTAWSNGTIENNVITWSNTYGIWVDGVDNTVKWGSNPLIKNNTITDTGRGLSTADGIQITYYSSPIIRDTVILRSTEDGMYIGQQCNPYILNVTISGGNFGIASGATGMAVNIINASINNTNLYDMSISGAPGSFFYLLNTTFNKSKIYFSDAFSNLTVRWFLHTYVNDTLGNPVPNATVRIQDNANGTYGQNFTTDANGYVNWTVLTEYYQNQSTSILYTPYNITVSKNGYNPGYASVDLNESKYITITLNATPATMGLNVTSGWNLISVPLIQGNTTLPVTLLDLSGDTTWDHIQWYDPLDPANLWKQYYTNWSSSLNDLTNVNHTIGIWINITSVGDGILNISGYLPASTSINLYSGWNLIGYPARDDSIYTDGQLKAATGATIVENFDVAATYRTKVLSDGYVMKRGEAYWVYVPTDTTWTVDW